MNADNIYTHTPQLRRKKLTKPRTWRLLKIRVLPSHHQLLLERRPLSPSRTLMRQPRQRQAQRAKYQRTHVRSTRFLSNTLLAGRNFFALGMGFCEPCHLLQSATCCMQSCANDCSPRSKRASILRQRSQKRQQSRKRGAEKQPVSRKKRKGREKP